MQFQDTLTFEYRGCEVTATFSHVHGRRSYRTELAFVRAYGETCISQIGQWDYSEDAMQAASSWAIGRSIGDFWTDQKRFGFAD
jgi:hypothetical protein